MAEFSKRLKNYDSFASYITLLSKEHPDNRGGDHKGMTGSAVETLDSIVRDLATILTSQASVAAMHSKKKTLMASDVITAIRLSFPRRIAERAVAAAGAAVTRENASMA